MRILVVEDDDAVGESLEMVLEDMGHQVLRSRDAGGALETMAQEPGPDFLVTDFNLGGPVTGADLAESFVNRYPKGPVVVISGRPDVALQSLSARCHARFLPKPFQADDLSIAMEDALRLAHVA